MDQSLCEFHRTNACSDIKSRTMVEKKIRAVSMRVRQSTAYRREKQKGRKSQLTTLVVGS